PRNREVCNLERLIVTSLAENGGIRRNRRGSQPQAEVQVPSSGRPTLASSTEGNGDQEVTKVSTEDGEGLRDRLARQSEDALGKLAQDLLENPLVNGAITRAFSARERAVHAQEAAMGALNVPSAADVERLTKRLRSVSQRLEGVEERLDDIKEGIDRLNAQLGEAAGIGDGLAGIEARFSRLGRGLGGAPAPVHRSQERLAVDSPPPAKKKPAARRPAAKKKK